MASKSPETTKKIKDPVSVDVQLLRKCVFIDKVCTKSKFVKESMKNSRSIVQPTSTSKLKSPIIILTFS